MAYKMTNEKVKAFKPRPGTLLFLQKGSTYRIPGTIIWQKIDEDELVFVISSVKRPSRITCLRTDGQFIAFDSKFEGFNELTNQ